MATFTVNIDCDNAAFEESLDLEVARILREIADKVENSWTINRLNSVRDINGNTVAHYQFEKE